jgi:D-3-phosphoglycerate dehydrogenase
MFNAKKIALYYPANDNYELEFRLLRDRGLDDVELITFNDDRLRYDTEAFLEQSSGADAVIIECMRMTDALFEHLPKLRILALHAIGSDHVDICAATKHGVVVANAPGFCREEVALHTLTFMLELTRGVMDRHLVLRNGRWEPIGYTGARRLSELTVGLVFFGGIPQYLTTALKSLGAKVIAWAPTKSAEFLESFGASKANSLDELLFQADIVSLHCPLVMDEKNGLPSTYHLMGETEFAKMKKTAYFINTSRGACVDESALVHALRSGSIAGAAVDVLEDEKTLGSELIQMNNCIVTPHSAWFSQDAFSYVRHLCLSTAVDYLLKKTTPRFIVNPEVLYAVTGREW